jgi:hypothetical protein
MKAGRCKYLRTPHFVMRQAFRIKSHLRVMARDAALTYLSLSVAPGSDIDISGDMGDRDSSRQPGGGSP